MEFTYRGEIISNQSIQDEVIDFIEQEIMNVEYTIVPSVQGKGLKSKKLGDTIWPEMNFILIVYTDEEGSTKIKEIVKKLKERFPNEGISLFFTTSV